MKNKLIIFSLLLAFFVVLNSNANCQEFNFDTVFNQNLSEEEKNELLNGQVLIRNTKKSINLVLNPIDSKSEELLNKLLLLKPSYLAEIIQIVPVKSQPKILSKINKVVTDIPSFKGIPYYSEHNQVWDELYSTAEITSDTKSENSRIINADFTMSPFGDFSVQITVETFNDSIYFENFNTTEILYNKIRCILVNKMQSYIYVFKNNDYWVLYGIGAVKAPKIPGVTERVETSFMNRIKTFCSFVFSKI